MSWLKPELAPGVSALITTREGPDGQQDFNLATHAGDQVDVAANRQRVIAELGMSDIQWLEQVHGSDVCYVDQVDPIPKVCDAVWTDHQAVGLAIMTADCVPILLSDAGGAVVGAAHAGWQGVKGKVVTALIAQMPVRADQLSAYIGPAIGKESYEVGEDVWSQFPSEFTYPHADPTKRYLDLVGLVGAELEELGVRSPQVAGECVYRNDAYYSHRATQAKGRVAGRFVSAIGLKN